MKIGIEKNKKKLFQHFQEREGRALPGKDPLREGFTQMLRKKIT